MSASAPARDRLPSGLCILRSHRHHAGLHEDPDGNRHRAETQKLANQPEPPDCLSEVDGRAAVAVICNDAISIFRHNLSRGAKCLGKKCNRVLTWDGAYCIHCHIQKQDNKWSSCCFPTLRKSAVRLKGTKEKKERSAAGAMCQINGKEGRVIFLP